MNMISKYLKIDVAQKPKEQKKHSWIYRFTIGFIKLFFALSVLFCICFAAVYGLSFLDFPKGSFLFNLVRFATVVTMGLGVIGTLILLCIPLFTTFDA